MDPQATKPVPTSACYWWRAFRLQVVPWAVFLSVVSLATILWRDDVCSPVVLDQGPAGVAAAGETDPTGTFWIGAREQLEELARLLDRSKRGLRALDPEKEPTLAAAEEPRGKVGGSGAAATVEGTPVQRR